MEKLRVGVIGLGMMGVFHAKVYKNLPGVELVGGYDVSAASAENFTKQLGVKTYATYEDMLKDVDAVSVCTPDHLHKEPILKALAAGVRCLVEKPLATSTADCMEILAARPDPTYIMVGHLLRFDPRVWHARTAVQNGTLGKICSINIWRNNSRAAGLRICQYTSVAWFLGIHDIDAVHFITGRKVIKISANGKNFFTPHYDYVVSNLELEDGIIVTMENGFTLPNERFTGMLGGIRIIGELGMIEVDMNHNGVCLTTQEQGRSLMQDTYHWPLIGGEHYGDLRAELEAFVKAAANKELPPVTGEDGTEAVKVIEQIMAYLDMHK